MNETNQEEVIRFLRSGAWKRDGAAAKVVETHGAYVFLAGDEALKIKRAVAYDYMDSAGGAGAADVGGAAGADADADAAGMEVAAVLEACAADPEMPVIEATRSPM